MLGWVLAGAIVGAICTKLWIMFAESRRECNDVEEIDIDKVLHDLNQCFRKPVSPHGNRCPGCTKELDHKAYEGHGASKCTHCNTGWYILRTSRGDNNE